MQKNGIIDDSEFQSPESSLEDDIIDLDHSEQQLLKQSTLDHQGTEETTTSNESKLSNQPYNLPPDFVLCTPPRRPEKSPPVAVVFSKEYVCRLFPS